MRRHRSLSSRIICCLAAIGIFAPAQVFAQREPGRLFPASTEDRLFSNVSLPIVFPARMVAPAYSTLPANVAPPAKVAPPANWRSPYSDFRLGIFEASLSALTGRVSHAFSGMSASESTLLGVEMDSYGTFLGLFIHRLLDESRLRVADYYRIDVGVGVQKVRYTEVSSDDLRPLLLGTSMWIDLRAAIGVQANLLVTSKLEVGGVAGKFFRMSSIWDSTWDEYIIPSLRGARLRYRNLAGEFQTATGPVRTMGGSGSGAYEVQDTYRTLRLRHNRTDDPLFGFVPLVGLDVERWGHRLTRDGEPFVIRSGGTSTDATHVGTLLRFVIGFNY